MSHNYPEKIKPKIKQLLIQASSILFPGQKEQIQKLIKSHTWWDRKYVGEVDDQVCAWSGYSINLAHLDSRYRGLYGDYVQNQLPLVERRQLFGDEFAIAIQNFSSFVAIFNLDIPLDAIGIVTSLGFIPRKMNRCSHVCLVYSPEEFLDTPLDLISLKVAKMVILQRNIAIHRQPLDSIELPFQKFLFHSNYLNDLVLKEGLLLNSISDPRETEYFGHRIEIKTILPKIQHIFNIGVEVFMKNWGDQINSVATYIEQFSLNGLVVISKDMPEEIIRQLQVSLQVQIILISRLIDFPKHLSSFPIYHISLSSLLKEIFKLEYY